MKGLRDGDCRWWWEAGDREGGSIEGVGRIFQTAVELRKKER